MTYLQQIYSRRIFTVKQERSNEFILRPYPDDHGPDIILPRQLYEMRWRVFTGDPDAVESSRATGMLPQSQGTDTVTAVPKPASKPKRRRGK